MPLVSIIIPLHNRAAELPQTLDCLLAQSSRDWEAIVVDDHSTDGAADVARDYAARDQRIRVVALPDPKRGAPAGRNLGLSLAAGEFVIFLDSDDLITRTCVERRLAYMRSRPAMEFAVWRCQLFRETPGDIPLLWNADTGEEDLDRLLKMDVPWQTTSPIWRRSSLGKLALPPAGDAGGPSSGDQPVPQIWDEAVLSGQDWEFHIRAVATGLKYVRVDEIDCHWRVAGPGRESIGKASLTNLSKDHARARPLIVRKMHDFVQAQGLLTQPRRRAFAAMYFGAANNLAERVSRREARATWREAFALGLVNRGQFKQADRYLFLKRWPALAERVRHQIGQTWARGMLPQRGKFFNVAPVDPARAPTISVVTSAYNNAPYIRAAVDSILKQSFRDFEFIIIDDGSTDATGDILRDYADSDCRIRLVSRENKGLTVSLNEGLALARGEFIARMDSDDIADPTRFEKQLAYLRAHPECVAIGSRIETIDPFDAPIDRPDHKLSHDEIDAELMQGVGWALVHPVVTFRASALRAVGGYREHYNNVEDLDLFLRLAEVGKLANLPDVLLKYRQHLGSVNHQKFERQMKLKMDVLREAYERRGLSMPTTWDFKDKRHVDPNEQHRFWGWRAIKTGHLEAAKQHALRAIKAKPSSIESWKLLRCAIRGH